MQKGSGVHAEGLERGFRGRSEEVELKGKKGAPDRGAANARTDATRDE